MIAILLFASTLITDFDSYMGKQTEHFSHLQDAEEIAQYERFRALYEKNIVRLEHPKQETLIPHVVHFIWLGPRPFPPQSVANVRSWMARHPNWQFKFWTDRSRPSPCSGMQVCDVSQFPFQHFGSCYAKSENWGEKSDLLRFEILDQEGGVYVDHDASCEASFTALHSAVEMYCCLEVPHSPVGGHNMTAGIGVLGARAHHPTIQRTIELIKGHWEELEKKFASRDSYARTQLVMQRTYLPLTKALETTLGEDDIVLPAAYFFAKGKLPALFSRHLFANSWADPTFKEKSFEKQLQQGLKRLSRQSSTLFYLALILFACNAGYFFYRWRKS